MKAVPGEVIVSQKNPWVLSRVLPLRYGFRENPPKPNFDGGRCRIRTRDILGVNEDVHRFKTQAFLRFVGTRVGIALIFSSAATLISFLDLA